MFQTPTFGPDIAAYHGFNFDPVKGFVRRAVKSYGYV